VAIILLTTPLEVIPTEDGKGFYHIFNTAPSKLLFNTANLNLSMAAAGVVYHAVGGVPGTITFPSVLAPGILYIVCAVGLNAVFVAFLYYLEYRAAFFVTFGQMAIGMVPSLLCSATLGYFLAMLLSMPTFWPAILFVLPLRMTRFSFRLYLSAQKQQYNIIRAFATALEAKDTYTEGHSSRVSLYSVRIAQKMGLSGARVRRLETAAIFHDIGKIGVPDSILGKPGMLTPEERAVIQRHPATGVSILQNMDTYEDIIPLVLHHHEFFDGRGYPDGTSGDDLPLETYILGAAVDAYDAHHQRPPLPERPHPCGGRPHSTGGGRKQFHTRVAQVVAKMAEGRRTGSRRRSGGRSRRGRPRSEEARRC
jgi:putative nucleotidyltransferase with HDIG domain